MFLANPRQNRREVSRLRADGRRRAGFALYEVLLGVMVFVVGVLALGRSVQNCLTASTLTAEDSRIRLILANRMAEVQATPGVPDSAKETKVDTGYGMVKLIQKTVPAQLTEEDGVELTGVNLVTLKAEWDRGGVTQSESVQFYVYRGG
jgi:Tfp pilus assembly protein PilV